MADERSRATRPVDPFAATDVEANVNVEDAAWEGAKRGLGFGFVAGTLLGIVYVMETGFLDGLPWEALLVHAYTIACGVGATLMASMSASRHVRHPSALRFVAFVVVGACAGAFGATTIATLPGTPYPGPVLATATLVLAALVFAQAAMPEGVSVPARIVIAFMPLVCLVPFAPLVASDEGVLGFAFLEEASRGLGLARLGTVVGSVAGVCVFAYVELCALLGHLEGPRRLLRRRGFSRTRRSARRRR